MIDRSSHDRPVRRRYAALAETDIDVDKQKAHAASEVLGEIIREFIHWHAELEEVIDALGRSAPKSARARVARHCLNIAYRACDEVMPDLSDAQDALDFPRLQEQLG